ncbi:MAG TPA: protein kinase [Candidatus Krumholzibacteria bacterium]
MIGRKLLHYDILESLGEGGMGVIYKAMDTRLNRPVALKFIAPSRLGDEQNRTRLVNEARSAASLRHPNICTVYDIEETPDGQTFISMAYLEGQSLRDRIQKEGRLPVEETLRIISQVAEGLREAHARGVVHRDIKSANILLTDRDEAVILDFGLAKVPSGASVTQTDTFSGTVAYASPEQIRGDRVDHRTDLWSLGVVWYEMLTGALPFAGETLPTSIHSVLESTPTPIRSLRGEVPAGVERIVSRLMQKQVAQRTPDASTLLEEMRTLTSAATPEKSKTPSIAVLPFANMSNDPEQTYFCDGIAEDIINDLTRIEGLRVAARTTSFAHRAASVDIREIGTQIGVDSVLEGSVRKAGNRLRITAQLIDVSNGYHIWSERWDRELADVFAIQDEIAHAITAALRVKLTPRDEKMLATPGTTDVQAYDLFLQGRRRMYEGQRGLRESRLFLKAAVERDPKFARAHAMLALAGVFIAQFFAKEAEDLITPSREAAEKALELDPNLPEAHTAKAYLLAQMGQEEEAERAYLKAIELNPDLYEARYFYGRLMFPQQRWPELIEQWERAIAIDPEEYQCSCLVISVYRDRGWSRDRLRPLLERAKERVSAYVARHPESPRAYYLGSGILFELGDREGGLHWVERALSVDPADPGVHYNVACTLAIAGEKDRSLHHIERAIDCGYVGMSWLSNDPDLISIRDEPRFKAAIARSREGHTR